MRDFVGAEAADDATVVVRFAPKRGARRAAVRRRAADLLARLLRDARRSTRRRSTSPLGSRPLQGRPLRGRPLHRIRARQGLVGRRPAGRRAGRTISTSCASNSTATATSPSKASPARAICSARNSPRASGRRATTFPAIRDGRVKRDDPARRHAVGRAGLVHQHAAREVQGPAPARGARSTPSISNGPTRTSCTASYERTALGVPELRHDGGGQAGARRSSRCSSRSAARCRTRCSASRSCRRSPTARARTARCCARRARCCRRPATPIKDGKRVDAEGRADHASNS